MAPHKSIPLLEEGPHADRLSPLLTMNHSKDEVAVAPRIDHCLMKSLYKVPTFVISSKSSLCRYYCHMWLCSLILVMIWLMSMVSHFLFCPNSVLHRNGMGWFVLTRSCCQDLGNVYVAYKVCHWIQLRFCLGIISLLYFSGNDSLLLFWVHMYLLVSS